MKKTILGLCIGLMLGLSTNAFAATGDIIQATFSVFTLKVDGQVKALDADPLVYQGTTYLPVRVIANLVGKDVVYKSDSKTIELNTPIETSQSTSGGSTVSILPEKITITPEEQKSIERVEKQITMSKNRISEYEAKIEELEKEIEPTKKLVESTADNQRKMYYISDLENLYIKINAAKEQIILNQEIISDQQAYIVKIKAKYQTTAP